MPKVLTASQYKQLKEYVAEQLRANPGMGLSELAEPTHVYCMANFKVSPALSALRQFIYNYKKECTKETPPENVSDIEGQILGYLKRGKPHSITDVANALNVGPRTIIETLTSLQGRGYSITIPEGEEVVKIEKTQPSQKPFQKLNVDNYTEGQWQKFGLISDTHLCSEHERLDVVNALYDIFEDEGIDKVFLPGNYIDGEHPRINRFEVKIAGGFGKQMKYFCENFPEKSGMKTYYIDADEHEGWYFRREGIIPGQYLQYTAQDLGREDLVFLGYLEADIAYSAPDGKTLVRLFHPKRGTAYAVSYSCQKIVESYQGGEKPEILLVGHFHKAEYMPNYRNIHVIQAGCTQDQSTFMRGKSIEAHVGGWVIQFKQRPDGSVCRLRAEFIGFYDRKYHIKHEFLEEK